MENLIIPTSDLTIQRNIMPQIQSKDIPAFLEWLKKDGVKVSKKRVPLSKIKPSQGEFNPDKIRHMMKKKISLDKPAIMSKDMYIADGHHRYASDLNKNEKGTFPVWEVGLNIHELLSAMRRFDLSYTKEIHENKSILARIRKILKS